MKDIITNIPTNSIGRFLVEHTLNNPIIKESHPKEHKPFVIPFIAPFFNETNNVSKQTSQTYLDFVAKKDDMLSKTQDLKTKQTIKHWLRSNNIDLFNWMLNDENGQEALKYIQKYGRIGIYKAEKLFADNSIPKEEIAERLIKSDPKKADI